MWGTSGSWRKIKVPNGPSFQTETVFIIVTCSGKASTLKNKLKHRSNPSKETPVLTSYSALLSEWDQRRTSTVSSVRLGHHRALPVPSCVGYSASFTLVGTACLPLGLNFTSIALRTFLVWRGGSFSPFLCPPCSLTDHHHQLRAQAPEA